MTDKELFARWPAEHNCQSSRTRLRDQEVYCGSCGFFLRYHIGLIDHPQLILAKRGDRPTAERIAAGQRRLVEARRGA